MEQWKPIPGFSRYEASNLGNLRSLDYKKSGKVKVLKPALTFDGYLKTMLLDDEGRYRSWHVHKWVALAWNGPRNGLEVNHINGIKTDNRPVNLEYCTRSQNCQHSFDTGLQKPKRGVLNGMAKLSDNQVLEIREYVNSFPGRYYGRKDLAAKYGISEAHLKDIVSGRRGVWNHV